MTDTTNAIGYNPSGKLLGHIVWYTIESAWVAPADMQKWFEDLLLDERHLRVELSRTEAFRRAFSPNEHRYKWSPEEGVEATLRCEIIKLSATAQRSRVVRRIVMSRTDAKKSDISFQTEMAEATFFKDAEDVKINYFTNDPDVAPHVRQYAEELTARFERRANFLDSDKVRGIVRRYIENLNAVMVRRGVYFVHASRSSTISQLQDLVGRCSTASSMRTIPLPDVPEQRDMVSEAFNTEIVEQANSLLDSMIDQAKGGPLPKAKYDALVQSFTDIRSRIHEYRTALGESQERAEVALELVEDHLVTIAIKEEADE